MIIDSHQHLMLPTELQLEKMDEAGIDKTILFCTTPHMEHAKNFEEIKAELNVLYKTLAGKDSAEAYHNRLIKNIHELTEVISQHSDRFYGFGSVPLDLSAAESRSWVENHIIANGLKGIGEFTPGSDTQESQLPVLFETLKVFPGLPVWIHTFDPVSLHCIKTIMKLTKENPDTPVIYGHMGGYHWMDVIEFAKTTPNAYVDLSGTFSHLAVRTAIEELPDQCLFGTDAPFGEPILYRQVIEYVSPTKEIALNVLGRNIERLLG